MSNSIDQQFIEYIVKSLVGNPDKVLVERRIDEKGVLLELTVDPEDLGRVIGKRGSTAQSLRTLLRALGTKNDARYNLKIVDTGPPKERSGFSESSDSQSSVEGASQEATTGTDNSFSSPPAPTSADDEVDLALARKKEETSHSDVLSRTRAELADLDDLEV